MLKVSHVQFGLTHIKAYFSSHIQYFIIKVSLKVILKSCFILINPLSCIVLSRELLSHPWRFAIRSVKKKVGTILSPVDTVEFYFLKTLPNFKCEESTSSLHKKQDYTHAQTVTLSNIGTLNKYGFVALLKMTT